MMIGPPYMDYVMDPPDPPFQCGASGLCEPFSHIDSRQQACGGAQTAAAAAASASSQSARSYAHIKTDGTHCIYGAVERPSRRSQARACAFGVRRLETHTTHDEAQHALGLFIIFGLAIWMDDGHTRLIFVFRLCCGADVRLAGCLPCLVSRCFTAASPVFRVPSLLRVEVCL